MAYAADKAAVLAAMESIWLPLVRDAMVDSGRTADQKLFCCYYDVIRYAIRAKQEGLINSTLCDQLMANFRTTYRDSYLVTSGYNPSAPFLYTTGLALDYLVNGQTASKTAIGLICSTTGFINNSTTTAKYTEIHYARELAFSLSALINNYRVGNVGSPDAKIATFKSNAFTLLSNWQTGTATLTQFYIRPFMMALVIDALILYHENITPLTTGEKNAIEAAVTYVDTNLWRSGDTHPSLKFTSVQIYPAMSPTNPNTSEQAGLVSQNTDPDNQDGPGTAVELMFLAARAWLISQGIGSHTTRFDDALTHNYPHYSGGFIQYGAYLGNQNLAGVNGKFVNEQMWTLIDAFKWRETTATSNASSGTSTVKTYVGGGGYYGGRISSSAPSLNPSSFYSGATQAYFFDETIAAKVLNSGGTAAGSGVAVQTVNDASSGVLSLVQATGANQGSVITGLGTNLKQALKVTGSPQTYALTGTNNTGLLKNVSKVSFGVAFKLKGTGGNARFHRQVDSTFSVNTFNATLASATPTVDMAITSSGQTTSISNQTLSLDTIYFLLYEWDSIARTGNIYVNGTGGLGTSSFPASGAIENLNANTAPDILSAANVEVFCHFLMTGALCSNVAGLTSSVRSYIGF